MEQIVLPRELEQKNNAEALRLLLPPLPVCKIGQYALMHNRRIVEYYDYLNDAIKAGFILSKEGMFSIHKLRVSAT